MPFGFNDDRSKEDLSGYALKSDLNKVARHRDVSSGTPSERVRFVNVPAEIVVIERTVTLSGSGYSTVTFSAINLAFELLDSEDIRDYVVLNVEYSSTAGSTENMGTGNNPIRYYTYWDSFGEGYGLGVSIYNSSTQAKDVVVRIVLMRLPTTEQEG